MANLSIKKLDDTTSEQLPKQSKPQNKIGDIFKNFFGEKNGIDLKFEMQHSTPHLPMDSNSDSD